MEKINVIPPEEFIDPKEKIAVIPREDSYTKPHTHDFIELVYIRKGHGVHVINDRRYDISPGDLLFINYGQNHIVEGNPSFELVNIIFTPEFISNSLISSENIYDLFSFVLADELDGEAELPVPVAHLSSKERAHVESVIDAMLSEYGTKAHGYHSLLKSYTQVIICLMLRSIRQSTLSFSENIIHKLAPEILNYVDKNHAEKISLRELAKNSFYSPNYFSRLFKECYGKNLSDYIKEKRISHAAELLRTTDLSITQICEAVGYHNRQIFNKFFKEITGYTPSEYRVKFDSDV